MYNGNRSNKMTHICTLSSTDLSQKTVGILELRVVLFYIKDLYVIIFHRFH